MNGRCPVRTKTGLVAAAVHRTGQWPGSILNSITVGLGDDIERYYRVIFKETPVTVFPGAWSRKTEYCPSVSMSTILIVRPRKTRFQYEINEATGTIKNTGNTYFRVILQKGCNGDDESSTQFYMLPGDSWTGPEAKNSNRKYIVALGRYHKLGDGCFMDAPG